MAELTHRHISPRPDEISLTIADGDALKVRTISNRPQDPLSCSAFNRVMIPPAFVCMLLGDTFFILAFGRELVCTKFQYALLYLALSAALLNFGCYFFKKVRPKGFLIPIVVQCLLCIHRFKNNDAQYGMTEQYLVIIFIIFATGLYSISRLLLALRTVERKKLAFIILPSAGLIIILIILKTNSIRRAWPQGLFNRRREPNDVCPVSDRVNMIDF
eukprot:733422_1